MFLVQSELFGNHEDQSRLAKTSEDLLWLQGGSEQEVLPLVFGQQGAEHGMHAMGQINAEVYISRPLEGHSTQARQYMYINSRFVTESVAAKLLGSLYKQVCCACDAIRSLQHVSLSPANDSDCIKGV